MNKKYTLNDKIVIKNILNETYFMLDGNSGKQYNLTEMEYEIIDMFVKGNTIGAIANRLQKEYDADNTQIEHDLLSYVRTLLAYDLLTEIL